MKSFLLPLFLLGCPGLALASGDPFPIGARSLGLGNAAVTLSDHWSLFNNVGGLAGTDRTAEGRRTVMSSFSGPYGVAGLSVVAVGAVLPTRYGTFGVGVQRFGDELHHEHLVGLAYSHRLENVSLGVKINYVQIATRGLGSRGAVAIEFGGVVQLLPELRFGAHLYNLNQAKLAAYGDERLPTLMKAGLSYQPGKQLMMNAEVEKDVDFPAVFKAGLEYEIVKKVHLRTGISAKPFTNHFGVGLLHRNLHFDYALTTHPQLGFSHHLSLALGLETKATTTDR
ncbi:MAG: hypothetical protein H7Z75_03420 [Ferruginibacter sp.]|nr:hypothetical protein [Cytophagales bacterium]